jgi:hypothetical protein
MSEQKKAKTITVVDYVDAAQLKADLAYSTADLSTAFMKQASLFAHYGILAAKASRQVNNIKMLVENTEAQVSRIIRDELAATGAKVTEGNIAAQVTRHERVRAAQRALNEARQIEDVTKTAVEAFRHRRDMLIQQGFIQREEMKGELKIGAANERAQDVEDLKAAYMARAKNKSAEAA